MTPQIVEQTLPLDKRTRYFSANQCDSPHKLNGFMPLFLSTVLFLFPVLTVLSMSVEFSAAAPLTGKKLTLTVNITGNGSVALVPPGGSYPIGKTVTLTANPDNGHRFDHWEENLTGTANPKTIEMNGNKIVTAVFTGNMAPVAVDDSAVTSEDTPVVVLVLANDNDADGDALSISSFSQGTSGGVGDNGDGTVTYTPDTNFNGGDTFSYSIEDGNGGTASASVGLTVSSVNDPPVAVDDSATVGQGEWVRIDVLVNDRDVDGDALSISSFSQGGNGAVVDNGDGTVTYTPNADFSGSDSFTYTASDSIVDSSQVTVTVMVTPYVSTINTNDDNFNVNEDSILTVPAPGVLTNDSDTEGKPLTSSLDSGPANGTTTLNADGSFTYTPAANFNGTDSFTYTASDGTEVSAPTAVTISVMPMNDPPVSTSARIVTSEDSLSMGVTPVVTDPDDGDSHSFVVTSQPSNGMAFISNQVSETKLVWDHSNVSGVVGYYLHYGQSSKTYDTKIDVGHQTSYMVPGLQAGQTYYFAMTSYSASGQEGAYSKEVVYQLPTTGQLVYVPEPEFSGTDSFTIEAVDRGGLRVSGSVEVTVTSVNDAPIAISDVSITAEDTAVAVTVLTNDSDAEGDSLTVALVTSGAIGNASIIANDTILYTPYPNQYGDDIFTYIVSDGNDTAAASVSVTIEPVEDPPVTVDDFVTTSEDTAVVVMVLVNDSDADNDSLSISGFSQGGNGTVVDNGDGTLSYTPDVAFSGSDSFTYTASDGKVDSALATVTVTVTPANTAPVAVDDEATTAEDIPVVVDVLVNDRDVDGDTLSISSFSQGTSGGVVDNGDGTVTYTPDTNFNGNDTFSYSITDGNGGTASASVGLTVSPVNDPPVAVADFATASINTSLIIDLVANDYDDDGDTLTISSIQPPKGKKNSTVSITENNELLYEPKVGFTGQEILTYTVSDGNGNTASSNIYVEVVESASAETTTTTSTDLDNAGFESGDFTGWLTIGETTVETAAFGSGPPEGTFQVLLSTAGPVENPEDSTGNAVSALELEMFLQLPSGSLDGIATGPVMEGSAIKRTVAANAGDVLTFDWNFLTHEYTLLDEPDVLPSAENNDFAFVSITEITQLSDTFSIFIFSTTDYAAETGFDTFSFPISTTGVFSLGVGVVDTGDEKTPSALLVDNFSLNPTNQ